MHVDFQGVLTRGDFSLLPKLNCHFVTADSRLASLLKNTDGVKRLFEVKEEPRKNRFPCQVSLLTKRQNGTQAKNPTRESLLLT